MKFFRILFLVLFVSFSCSMFSQESVNLNWETKNIKGNNIVSFDAAVYLEKHHGLPSFQVISKIDQDIFYDIEIFDIEFINVSYEEKIKLPFVSLTENVSFSSESLISSSNTYNRILVFPYVKLGDLYQKINSFKYRKTNQRSKSINRIKSPKINSVLDNGDWYKISVSQNGIYSLSLSDLELLGINTNNLSVNSIRLYGNGGGMLPRVNSDFRHIDLLENAIQIIDKNNNGFFENEDLILFYGESVDQWNPDENYIGRYNHFNHLYDHKNYYFLTINHVGYSKRIQQYIYQNKGDNQYSDKFNFHEFHESNSVNFIQSGDQWYGEIFDADLKQTFSFSCPNLVANSDVYIHANVAGRSFAPSSFIFNYNDNQIMNLSLNNVVSNFASDYATLAVGSSVFQASGNDIEIEVEFNRSSSSHKGWLDYIEVCGFRDLIMSGSQMNFRKTVSSVGNQTYNLELSNITPGINVWHVTDPTNVLYHNLNIQNNVAYFSYDMDIGISDEKFIAFDGTEYKTPDLLGSVNNQNLHGETDFEMLIVSHPNFLSAANELSNFHLQQDGSKCKVVTPQQIYNEFSSGKQDVSAIRDYCKYLYDLPNTTFKYLLLMGDASYDPKDRISNNTNFIITYQSSNSVSPLNTFATDDYFGFLDDNEGLLENDLVDIGIGRLPAKTIEEANNMVDKIIHYYDKESRGDWRNMTCFIADDGDDSDGNIHMSQAESLSNIIDDNHNTYNIHKIYLDDYNQEATPAGQRSPQTRDAINRRIENGALLINYTGHGGELGLTKERIVELEQILDWENYDNLPLFVTATCEFGRFDNPQLTSAGEHVILNANGGSVGILTTTRYVYSHLNYSLNTNFINTLFDQTNGDYQTLGDIFLKTKAISGTSINSNKFILLGDPMMKLSYPRYNISTTVFPDTIAALGKVSFHGEILDENSIKMSGFNGVIYTIVFDKETTAETQGQESCTPMPYRQQNNIIYKGKSSITNGDFSFSFIVPKDIDYNIDYGRVSYYAIESTDNLDASGFNESFLVGGISSNIIDDDIGPDIQLYMNDKQFVSGGITNTFPTFLAFVTDSSGINTIGNGIGHDIAIVFDGDNSSKIVLNEYYEADIDSYQSGKVEYPLYDLSEGLHTIDFKIWDVFNNSSESSIEFFVSESEDFIIDHLLNYPNPFTNNTSFYFEHNRPNQPLEVQIQIFTISGKLVKTINSLQLNNGFRVGPIYWNGKDDFQDDIGIGTYIYKLRVKDANGEFVEKLEKLVILQ